MLKEYEKEENLILLHQFVFLAYSLSETAKSKGSFKYQHTSEGGGGSSLSVIPMSEGGG